MSCPGLHCPGCGDGGKLPATVGLVILAAVFALLDRILHAIEEALVITGILAACAILALVTAGILGVVHRMRSEHLMSVVQIAPEPRETVTATVIPQVTGGTPPLAIEHHVIHHHVWEGPAGFDAAAVVRSAVLPGDAGEIFTEE